MEDLTYKVKCRSCGKIETMFFSNNTDKAHFKLWAKEHSTFPIEKQCTCDNGSIMFHDLVSYKICF
jgi:hypothetical protein